MASAEEEVLDARLLRSAAAAAGLGDGDHDVGRQGGEFEGEEEPHEVIGRGAGHQAGKREEEEGVELGAVGAEGVEGDALLGDERLFLAVNRAGEEHEEKQADPRHQDLREGHQVRQQPGARRRKEGE
jgi:hypothetical protein